MPRNPRFVPPYSLQHVSDVVAQDCFLLTPSAQLNEILLGVLGKAQEVFEMTLCAAVVLGNHYHLLLRPRDAKHLADFMCFLKTNLSKEIGKRLRNWPGQFFDRRYRATTVSDEEAAQVQVLRYILSHGVKENLVDTVREWPGVHCAPSLIDGAPMVGRWYDRSAENAARQRLGAELLDPEDFASPQTVHFSPLPCWQHLPEATWRSYVEDMVDDIDRQGAVERKVEGKTSLGVAKILAQDPYQRPDEVSRPPLAPFHTATRQAFDAMTEMWRRIVEAYRAASARLRSGDHSAVFPEGTFPPSLPFVPFSTGAVGVLGVLSARGQPA
jgi:REP element-mobilizing transposase RayT